MNKNRQAGWVGKGWSLDTGYIALDSLGYGSTDLHYSLVHNGQSYELVRGPALTSTSTPTGTPTATPTPNPGDPTHWESHAPNESFMKIRMVRNGRSDSTTGGCVN